jgi:hypothetical protein
LFHMKHLYKLFLFWYCFLDGERQRRNKKRPGRRTTASRGNHNFLLEGVRNHGTDHTLHGNRRKRKSSTNIDH